MGIRYLNRFIQQRCPDTSKRIHLRDLSGKRIAVDTSIYMYRYSGEGALLENMYLMASVFRHYDIHAVFIFDGPPPPQKTDIIELRRKKKDQAKRQYDALAEIIKEKKHATASSSVETTEIDDIEDTMRELKKQFVRLRDCDIANVKELLVSFGFATIDAEGEADVLCAKLSLKKRVDACLSDDTDMFVYGCPVVLRHISLLNHSVVSYDTREILKKLTLTQQEFKMMCVVCGTDYTQATAAVSPEIVFKKITKFKSLPPAEIQKHHNSGGGFYDWYSEHGTGKKVTDTDTDTGAITYITNESMFDVISPTGATVNSQYKQLVVLNRADIHKQRIVEIMMKEDFIFIESSPTDKTIIKSLSSGNGSLSSSSQVYGIAGSSREDSPDTQASLLANDVYGVKVSSFQELQTFHKKNRRRDN
jgi:5'-3' exonuclease